MPQWRRWRRWSEDDGTAALEFLTAGMILLLPLVYLVLVMAAIQGGALAVEGAARSAARVFMQAESAQLAEQQARGAVEFALADHGLHLDDAVVLISCAPHPANCLTRRGSVTVAVEVSVPFPLAPPVLSDTLPLRVPVHAVATAQVSRFWGGQ